MGVPCNVCKLLAETESYYMHACSNVAVLLSTGLYMIAPSVEFSNFK